MNRGLVAALACALAGCLGANAQPCVGADGVTVLCPEGATCVQAGSSAVCRVGNSSVCGDGAKGSDEACDDGNTISGDGCSADCKSTEICGNGIVDVGESCDDGNLRSHDGCDSRCSPELPRWAPVPAFAELTPPGRTDAVLAYDGRHQVALLFGGRGTGGLLGDTWQWNGAWEQVFPFKSPAPRSGAAMAYAGRDGFVYLYGGADGADPAFADLWRWNGNVWENVEHFATDVRPPALTAARMAYDAHRERLVLFGGIDSAGDSASNTWELVLDGALPEWRAGPPGPARDSAVMAYDPVHEYILAAGGERITGGGGTVQRLTDTATYDGTAWTTVTTAAPIPILTGGGLAFDGTQMVLMTGQQGTPPSILTWTVDAMGSRWNGTAATHPKNNAVLAYVPGQGILMFSGTASIIARGAPLAPLGTGPETDLWTGSDFVEVQPQPLPIAYAAGFLDPVMGAPMMFAGLAAPDTTGGVLRAIPTQALLRLAPTGWQAIATAGTPPAPRWSVAGAYDEGQREEVFFGGVLADFTLTAETWTWSAARGWELAAPALSPPARRDHALAFDASRGKVVLFGGDTAGSSVTPLGDTWEWDGATRAWTEVTSAPAPTARTGASLAYDRARHEVVLFGGRTADRTALAETWVLTAAGWAQRTPAGPAPGPRSGAQLAWNPTRQRIVLFGGDSTIPEQDTWEWDGAAWHQLVTAPPPPRAGALFAATRDGMMLYGGAVQLDQLDGELADGWLLRFDGIHASESCTDPSDDDGDGLAGCADPDCWLACTPLCSPGDPCASPAPGPRCGDGACDPDETPELCPLDCAGVCGDGICGSNDCAGDCP